jgi:MATE family multidrug resistance protein
MGTTGITAQIFGEQDNNELRASLVRALIVAGALSFFLILFQMPIGWIAFQMVQGSELVEQYGRLYFDIRIWSAPATLMNYALLGWFLGMQNARAPLIVLVFVNLINMCLDLLFVMGWGLGADGVAWASLIAEYLGVVLALWLVNRELKIYPGSLSRLTLFSKSKIQRLLAVNRDIFIRNLCLMFTLAFFAAQGARFGDVVLAANAILFNMYTLMAYGLDGFAHAAEALVGKAVGSKNRNDYFQSIRVCGQWALLVSLLFSGIYYLSGGWIIVLMTDIASVRESALVYLPWLVLLPVVSVWSFVLDGIYVGATGAAEMRNTMIFSTFFIFLPVWYLLLPLQNHGLWMAFTLLMCARALSMSLMFARVIRLSGI